MNQAIQVTSRFLDLFTQVVICIKIEDVRYKVECILIVWHLGIQARQVEAISKIFLVNFTEIFVPSGRNELQNKFVSIVQIEL